MPYDLKPVHAPRLKGLSLRLFTAMIESALFRSLLLPSLFKNTGVAAFRKLAPSVGPTLFPLVRAGDEAAEAGAGIAIAEAVARQAPDCPRLEFSYPSIIDYARAYREGTVSPVEVGHRIVCAVKASNDHVPPLRSIIKCDGEDILAQATESAARIERGSARSLLEGVPVAIKDELDMPPYTTHVGTRFLGRDVPREDATPVARLRAAGALLIGKANMFEIGISPTGNNPIHGFARNPHNLDHDAGGSSGGCGAAVGSGLVPLAIGADGGGSIRVPASHCGVVGLKPTFGRVSEFGAAPLCWSVAHVGPLGATALDTAIGYAVCSGRDTRDPMSLAQPPVDLHDFHDPDLNGITLGVYKPWFEHADPQIVGACEQVLRILEAAGATIKEVVIDGLEATRVAHAVTILTEMAAAMEPYYAEHRKDFGHAVRINLALARQFSGRDYVRAQRIRTAAMAEWDRVLSGVDAVLTPATACPSPYLGPGTVPLGESDMGTLTKLMRFVVPANLCGLPAISFPAGITGPGLPIGIQAIGRHWEEALLLRLAKVAGHSIGQRKPAVCFDPLVAAQDPGDHRRHGDKGQARILLR